MRSPPTDSGNRRRSPHPDPPPEYRGREKCARGKTRNPAFTILELLIVIALITLLAALLLPAVTRAREHSKAAKCLSNLHQLGQAALAYALAYDGSFPISSYQNGLDWDFDARTQPVRPGILWMGGTQLAVQQCPSYDRRSTLLTDPFTGYNYNTSYIGGGVNEVTPLGHSHLAPMRIAAIHNAGRVALFGDGHYYGGTDKFMRAPILMAGTDIGDGVDFLTRAAGTQGYRHLGRTNVCYCDGHAESVPDRYITPGTSSGGTIARSTMAAGAGTGFLSPDNSAYDGGR